MCGIAGVVRLREPEPIAESVLQDMLQAVRFRGPDEFGLYRDNWAGLVSARLSIVDLTGGQQPIGNESKTAWIVFNGEVFNYPELRPDLEARGHRFGTQSDTEVILHLYEDFGPAFLNQLNGQFALALWDSAERSLLLARDRMGIRPLYYARQGQNLVFGSEIKSLLAWPGVTATIDPTALEQTFTYWSPLPPHSIFAGIEEVPPAHYLLVRDGEVRIQKYWSADYPEDSSPRTVEDYREELAYLLEDATRIRLRADVPVGAYLSGGVDSSVVAALVRRIDEAPLDTFSISFSDPEFDESSHQQHMARALGTDHHELVCTDADIARVFPDVIWHTETPILRTAPAPMYLLSGLVHQHGYKVVLTGEGADEVLAGYDIFKEMRLRRFWARQPGSALRPRLFERVYPDVHRQRENGDFWSAFFGQGLENTADPFYSHAIRWANTRRATRFLSWPTSKAAPPTLALPEAFSHWSALAQAQYLEMTTFLSPYLLSSQGDRMAMAHAVEGRYPFLDVRVIEFCARLPDRMKLNGLQEKWLLRQVARDLVPEQIWRRRKRPYRAPIRRTFFAPGTSPDYVSEMLAPESISRAGYFRAEAVAGLVRKAREVDRLSEVDEMALVGILSTQLVDHHFVRRQRSTPRVDLGPRLKVVAGAGILEPQRGYRKEGAG